jgi:hypothetical protein
LSVRSLLATSLIALMLAGCAKDGADFDETGGVKIVRSACPAVAVPINTGDVTLFSPEQSTDARAIDVVANLTDLHGNCVEQGAQLATSITFTVQARRANASGAREVVLPYFVTVLRGGTQIIAKQVGRVAVRFNDGELRATATGAANSLVSRAAATLPDEIERQITRRRRAGDADASIDPMSDPAIRSAVTQASFEVLVGFQLGEAQLRYNATR